ncbi:XRE family transcriptional regulator [Mycoplasma struthionis]|uniref:XRE family transcriptional regulator n=1 Tax=Mycoplasma struthionis TaxID=538220 RepID=A0A502M249_9MOLU|nr:XRE family transcriptional regulator [Mycoplasma struthionis]TPI01551.1 XRE family transcriptional regulator [Mycoplasma struthionis]
MIEQHICDMKHIVTHGTNFIEEIEYYLKKFSMTQKELAMRLGLSIKHINSIMNDEILDISVSIIEGMEYAFHLETGTLSEVYQLYSNIKYAETHPEVAQVLSKYGINFLIKHPELALAAKITIYDQSPLYIRYMMLKRFYGVTDFAIYDNYLKSTVLADEELYENPNSKVWIRFCELSAANLINSEDLSVFRTSMFQSTFKKVLNLMANESFTFQEKIASLKKSLLNKGIILITIPFIEDSAIKAVTLKKGAKRYIFLSDMYKSESHIFYSLLHEIAHCYNPDSDEKTIDDLVALEYQQWESKNNSSGYKAIYDAINAYQQSRIVLDRNKDVDTSYIWSAIEQKYPMVSFTEETDDFFTKAE